MQPPQIRPGVVDEAAPVPRVVAFFFNSAHGNSTIQLLTALGISARGLGVTPPEKIEGGQGMVLSIPCPDPDLIPRVESICRSNGGQVHRQAAR